MNKEKDSKDYMFTMIKKLINKYEEIHTNKEEKQGEEIDNEM